MSTILVGDELAVASRLTPGLVPGSGSGSVSGDARSGSSEPEECGGRSDGSSPIPKAAPVSASPIDSKRHDLRPSSRPFAQHYSFFHYFLSDGSSFAPNVTRSSPPNTS